MGKLHEAIRDFIRLFESRGVTYAILGGLAARALGIPRPTYDVDFTISVSRNELALLVDAAEELGYTVPVAYRAGWIDQVGGMPFVKFGVAIGDRSVDIDVFLAESPYLQTVLARRRREVVENDEDAWIVTAEDLIVLKVLSGRPRDAIDVQDVLFIQGELDREYMRHWAKTLGVLSNLDDALAKFDQQSTE
jgi:hypothetical protein